MSKSLNNYIGIDESPDAMFGKLMSISDDLMWRYFELLSFRTLEDIDALKAQTEHGRNPKEVKTELALEIVGRFHTQAAAEQANGEFNRRFAKGELPEDIDEFVHEVGAEGVPLANVLASAELTASTSEAHRMVKQGAVRLDGEKVSDSRQLMTAGTRTIVQVGKRRFKKIVLR